MNVPEDLLGSSVLEQPTGVSGGETSRGGMMGLGYEINPIRWSWMVWFGSSRDGVSRLQHHLLWQQLEQREVLCHATLQQTAPGKEVCLSGGNTPCTRDEDPGLLLSQARDLNARLENKLCPPGPLL